MVEAPRKDGSAEDVSMGQNSPAHADRIRLQRWAALVLSMDVMDGFSAISDLWSDLAAAGWLQGDQPSAATASVPIYPSDGRAEKQKPRWGYIGEEAAEEARQVAREFGDDVWSVKDASDFEDLLEACLDDPQTSQRSRVVVQAFFKGRFLELQGYNAFVASVCGKTRMKNFVASSLKEGFRTSHAIATLRERHTLPVSTGEADEYKMPDPIWRAMIGVVRAFVCLAALVDLSMSDRAPPDWLLKRVIKEFVDGQALFLGFAAMMYGDDDVPEDLLPMSLRLNKERIVREYNEREAVFSSAFSGAKVP